MVVDAWLLQSRHPRFSNFIHQCSVALSGVAASSIARGTRTLPLMSPYIPGLPSSHKQPDWIDLDDPFLAVFAFIVESQEVTERTDSARFRGHEGEVVWEFLKSIRTRFRTVQDCERVLLESP